MRSKPIRKNAHKERIFTGKKKNIREADYITAHAENQKFENCQRTGRCKPEIEKKAYELSLKKDRKEGPDFKGWFAAEELVK